MHKVTKSFIGALRDLEEKGDASRMAELFADDAEVSNPMVKYQGHGRQAALAFWQSYRSAFQTIRSEFRTVLEGDGVAMLEWTSQGRTESGQVRYGGVTVIEYRSDRLIAFRSYFDPPVLQSRAKARAAEEV